MVLRVLMVLCVWSFCTVSYAQNVELNKANEYFQAFLFKEAIPLYEKALASDPYMEKALANLAQCYWYTNDPQKAEVWFERALKYPKNEKYLLQYAQTLKMNRKYAEAQRLFLKYAKIDSVVAQHFAYSCDFAQKHLSRLNFTFKVENVETINSKSSDYAPVFYQDELIFTSSRSVAVEKEGEVVWTNDAFNQHYKAIKDNKDSLVDAKTLRSFIGKDINDAPMSYSQKEALVAITSNNFMEGIRHIDGSGLMMDIYLYDFKSMKEWDHNTEKFFRFNANVNTKIPYSTGHPSFSKVGNGLYFTSNQPGGMGGYDIYVCYKTSRGWTEPKNLGYPVNTAGNEMSPFVDEKGRLFFSSDWHEGFGGMDVFTAERFSFGWGNIQNLGNQVNSSYDEMYFVFQPQKQIGYYSSNRPEGEGNEDIYKVTQKKNFVDRSRVNLAEGEKFTFSDELFKSGQYTLSNTRTKEMYNLLLKLIDNPDKIIQINSFTDAKGSTKNNLALSQNRAKALTDFIISKGVNRNRIRYQGYGEDYLLNGCNDRATCTDQQHAANRRTEVLVVGHFDPSGNPIVTQNGFPGPEISTVSYNNNNNTNNSSSATKSTSKSTTKTSSSKSNANPVRKSHYAIGDVIEVANVYYEHGKSRIDERKSPGLKQLIEILTEHPHVVIEIGAHTDATGSSKYNLELSEKRAKAVKDFLIKKGVTESRLKYKGYGETKLLNRCKDGVKCSDNEHAVNRRTEFKVMDQKGFKVGDIIKVDDVFYELNKSKLDMDKSRGLQEALKILTDNKISVEIRSHTDAQGSSKYNLELSEKRAKAVYDYLVKGGVNKHRLKYKGYGETKLLNRCKDGVKCSDSDHAVNRRTDFKVIGLR